ncbi:MAG: cytochrome c [Pirellulales bacterium]|nr:cytochrome c [Pirellulales bacterium]
MKVNCVNIKTTMRWHLLAVVLCLQAGCDNLWLNTPVRFQPNLVEVAVQEKQLLGAQGKIVSIDRLETSPDTIVDIETAVEALFGTPDDPAVMPETGLDIAKLRRAAGPVWSDDKANTGGLYRQHCVHCHGVTGGGDGPTARTLNPYPRDFRYGVFKFKSTDGPARPTTEDLHRVLYDGIPGTAMPSFKLLRNDELDALVEYVKYLSMRGETEKALIFQALDSGEPIDTSRDNLLGDEVLGAVVENWNEAKDAIVYPKTVQPEDMPEKELMESIERGRKLYYTVKANCFSCHGYSARGDGVVNDYDFWNKMLQPEWTAIGALPKRHIIPRNLRDGVFRGGRRPLDVYRRIYSGINGSPMPAGKASLVQGDDDQAVWDLVNYVRNLPYELEELPQEMEAPSRSRN